MTIVFQWLILVCLMPILQTVMIEIPCRVLEHRRVGLSLLHVRSGTRVLLSSESGHLHKPFMGNYLRRKCFQITNRKLLWKVKDVSYVMWKIHTILAGCKRTLSAIVAKSLSATILDYIEGVAGMSATPNRFCTTVRIYVLLTRETGKYLLPMVPFHYVN